MADKETNISLAKRVLVELLGLSPDVIDRMIRTIKNSGDIMNIRTQIMRKRIGPRAMQLLKQTLKAAQDDGASGDNEKKEPEDENKKKSGREDKKNMKESFSSFLINELMIDIDPDDPNAAQMIKQQQRKAQRNPSQANREQLARARDERKAARSSGSPTSSVDQKIAYFKEQIAKLEKRKMTLEK